MPVVNGALATQLQPVARMRVVERPQHDQPPRKAPDFSQAVQSSLFHERSSNVIAMPPRVEVKPRIRTEVHGQDALAEARRQDAPSPYRKARALWIFCRPLCPNRANWAPPWKR